jgi:HD-like signal output (HDOD) protein
MRLVDNPRTTVQNLAVAIAADPAVAGSVLKLANSPLYRGSFVIANLHQAVVRLGMRNLRSMLLAVVLNSTRVKGKPFQSYSTLTWKHSLLCAQICSELARESKLDPEHAYMAGLFHNVGVLAVLSAARKLAVRQQKKISAHGVLELLSRHAYALNGTVIREWNLLDEIVTAVTGYRSWQEMPQDGDTPAPGTRYAALVDLSNALCKHYGIWVEYDHIAMAEHPAMEFLGLGPEALPARDWVLATSAKIERAAGVV